MNVNHKGTIGLIKVVADFSTRGYEVFLPFSDYSPVDLVVANTEFSIVRLQVKYREPNKKGVIEIPISSVVNGKRIKADRNKIDGWAVYCPTTDVIYYICNCDIPDGNHHFRISVNKSPKRLRYVEDYLDPLRLWNVQAEGRTVGVC